MIRPRRNVPTGRNAQQLVSLRVFLMVFWRIRLAVGRMACSLTTSWFRLGVSLPAQAAAVFRPGGPPTSAALSPRVTAAAAHSFRRRHPDFSRAHFVVGRFCVRVRPFQRHWGCRCPVAVSVSVDIHGIFGCPKQKSVVCPLEPGIVHGCLRQRAGPRLVCRSHEN